MMVKAGGMTGQAGTAMTCMRASYVQARTWRGGKHDTRRRRRFFWFFFKVVVVVLLLLLLLPLLFSNSPPLTARFNVHPPVRPRARAFARSLPHAHRH